MHSRPASFLPAGHVRTTGKGGPRARTFARAGTSPSPPAPLPVPCPPSPRRGTARLREPTITDSSKASFHRLRPPPTIQAVTLRLCQQQQVVLHIHVMEPGCGRVRQVSGRSTMRPALLLLMLMVTAALFVAAATPVLAMRFGAAVGGIPSTTDLLVGGGRRHVVDRRGGGEGEEAATSTQKMRLNFRGQVKGRKHGIGRKTTNTAATANKQGHSVRTDASKNASAAFRQSPESFSVPSPPVWRSRFSMRFSEEMYFLLFTLTTRGTYYYDFPFGRTRIDRDNGLGDRYCGSAMPGYSVPCTHLVVDGMRYLIFPSEKYCCKCCTEAAGCGVVRPDWLMAANATYLGHDYMFGVLTTKWNAVGLQNNYYWHAVDDRPMRTYMEYLEQMTFDHESYETPSAFPESLFAIPSDLDCSPSCYGACSLLQSTSGNRGTSALPASHKTPLSLEMLEMLPMAEPSNPSSSSASGPNK